jgi:hypothetical protein
MRGTRATPLMTAVTLVSAVVLVDAVLDARAQASAKDPQAHAFVAAKTPWGDPDLQGIWTTDSAFAIPAVRPEKFGTRAELTDKEFKKKVDRVARRQAVAKAGGNGNIPAMSQDAAWMTRAFRQTSLIVEPADGRVPPLTPQELERNGCRTAGHVRQRPPG